MRATAVGAKMPLAQYGASRSEPGSGLAPLAFFGSAGGRTLPGTGCGRAPFVAEDVPRPPVLDDAAPAPSAEVAEGTAVRRPECGVRSKSGIDVRLTLRFDGSVDRPSHLLSRETPPTSSVMPSSMSQWAIAFPSSAIDAQRSARSLLIPRSMIDDSAAS